MRRAVPIVLVLAVVAVGWVSFLKKGTSELPVYTLAGERMLGQDEIYRRDDPKPFSYPPFAAVPFVPFAFLPEAEGVQRSAWYLVNVAMLVAVVVVLRRIAEPWRLPGRGELWFWLAVAALTSRHVLATFQNQSNDLVVFFTAAFAARAFGRARSVAAGVWAGAGAAFKATPLLFAVPFAARRSVLALVGIGVAGGACSLVPDVLLPRTDGRLWIVAWYEIMVAGIGVGDTAARAGVWHPGSWLNQSLTGTLYRLTTELEAGERIMDVAPVHLSETGRKVVTAGAQLLVVVAIALAAWRRPRDDTRAMSALGLAGMTCCGMVLLSPMSSKSHFCVLALPSVFCVMVWMRSRDRLLGAMLVAVFVLGTLTTQGIAGDHLGAWLLAVGALTWATVLFVAASDRALRVLEGDSP